MKRILYWGVVLALLCGIVFAEGSALEKGALRWMAYNELRVRAPFLSHLEQALPEIAIHYDFVSADYFTTTLSAQMLSGRGPDLIEGGGETRLMASTGKLLDLTDQPFLSKYRAAGLAPFSVDGHVYAIPLQSWFEGVYYNKAIFAELGLTPPTTFDEWIELHHKLKAAGVKPQTMGAQSWQPLMKQSIGVVNSDFYAKPENAGFDAAFNDGEARLADSWLSAVKLWSRMIDEECLTPDMLGYSYEQSLVEFAVGEAAMWQSGPWSMSEILRVNPDIELGMFPICGANGGGWLVGGPGSALAVSADSPNQAMALRVLAAASMPEAQEALIAGSVGESYFEGVQADFGLVYAGCAEAFARERVYAPWTAAWTFGNPIVEVYGKALQEVLAGIKTVEQALTDADAVNDRLRAALLSSKP